MYNLTPLKEYESLYLINEKGEIYSLTKNKKLKQRLNEQGYFTVSLYKNKKYKTALIHRLVALMFVPNKLDKRYVNHINGDKTNNHFSNLEWCTHIENMQHAKENNLLKPAYGSRQAISKLTDQKVIEIRQKYIPYKYTHAMLAKEYNVTRENIREIVNGHTWKHLL